jgi:hypothetical protein
MPFFYPIANGKEIKTFADPFCPKSKISNENNRNRKRGVNDTQYFRVSTPLLEIVQNRIGRIIVPFN